MCKRNLLETFSILTNFLLQHYKHKNFLIYVHYTYWPVGERQQRTSASLVENEPDCAELQEIKWKTAL
jgi:hypothetical protein